MTPEREGAWLDRLIGRRVDPFAQRVVKILPSSPPRRGEYVTVDGVRSRVTRCRVKWNGREWTIRSLRVKEDESPSC